MSAAFNGDEGRFKKLYKKNVMSQVRKYKQGKIDLTQLEIRSCVPKDDLNKVIGLDDDEDLVMAVEKMLIDVNSRNRAARQAHNRGAHDEEVEEILKVAEDALATQVTVKKVSEAERCKLDWSRLPKHLIPEMMNISLYYHLKRGDYEGAALRINHGRRKRAQIEHMISLVKSQVQFPATTSPVKIIDLGGGRGDLALTLAHVCPASDVTVLDIKEISVQQALYRAANLGLSHRVHGKVCDLADYAVDGSDGFDVAVGLHCCAGLSDVAIDLCERNARHRPTTLIACTCCFGKMKQWFPHHQRGFRYPRTPHLGLDIDQYEMICRTAEDDRRGEISRRAKLLINRDRINAAALRASAGASACGGQLVSAEIVELPPMYSYKNEVLIMKWAMPTSNP